jgi:hypothetical protein
VANQQLNFFMPLRAADSDDISHTWALKNLAVNDIYVMGSIRITDKTFGELAINLN